MKYVYLLGLILYTFSINAQSITNEALTTSYIDNPNLTSSIGEHSAVDYFMSNNIQLTQGYLQVELKSNVAIVDANQQVHIVLFPNPSSDFINLDLMEIGQGKVELSIWDMNGKKIMTKEVHHQLSSSILHEININELANGNYYCHIDFKNESNKKFAIQFTKK